MMELATWRGKISEGWRWVFSWGFSSGEEDAEWWWSWRLCIDCRGRYFWWKSGESYFKDLLLWCGKGWILSVGDEAVFQVNDGVAEIVVPDETLEDVNPRGSIFLLATSWMMRHTLARFMLHWTESGQCRRKRVGLMCSLLGRQLFSFGLKMRKCVIGFWRRIFGIFWKSLDDRRMESWNR